ncbi:MAG: sugar ABC transporter substrate-binding protein [Actinomycetota bacterium]
MTSSRRWPSFLVLVLALLLVAAACGGDGGESTTTADGGGSATTEAPSGTEAPAGTTEASSTTEAAPAEPVDFSYPSWMWAEGAVGDWHQRRLAEFEAAFPHVTVDTTQIGSSEYEGQVTIQLAAGQVPDLLPAFTNMLPPLIAQDQLAPLDQCFEGTDVMDRILPSISVGQVDGVTYGVPLTMSPRGLLVNTKVLEEAGVAGIPETPEEFLEASRAVVANTDAFGYAFSTTVDKTLRAYIESMYWVLGYGADWSAPDGTITANAPSNIEALEMQQIFVDEGLTPVGLDRTDIRSLFVEGKAAFLIDGANVLGQVKGENPDLYPFVDYAAPPTPTHAAVTGGAFWAIPKESPNYDLACEYLKVNLAPDAQVEWLVDLTQIPATTVEPPADFLAENPWVETMVEVAALYPAGLGYAPPGYAVEAGDFRQIVVDRLATIFSGDATVADALNALQADLEAQYG